VEEEKVVIKIKRKSDRTIDQSTVFKFEIASIIGIAVAAVIIIMLV
jgi:hypothetical protein